MADEELIRHLFKLLNNGPEKWNQWRKENPKKKIDFSGHKFEGILAANLFDLDFSDALLDKTDFSGANLVRTNFSGAKGNYVSFANTRLNRANFTNATLLFSKFQSGEIQRANFQQSTLNNCIFSYAHAQGADFSSAILIDVIFNGARLNYANFNSSELDSADFTVGILDNATFIKASLIRAVFSESLINNVNFTEAKMGKTLFNGVDLQNAISLETLNHKAPSFIDISTIIKSKGKISEAFLRGCGFPDSIIIQIPALVGSIEPIQFYSCFISYSHADKSFARRLHDTLQGRGIRCWLDEHKIFPGDDIFEQVDQGIRLWDKILLCCSESSLTSWWVDNEINTAFEKEQELMRQRGHKILSLIPLNLDDFMFSDKWENGKAAQIKSRNAADFTEWQSNNKKFEEQFERLMIALRTDANAREIPPTSKL
jgi:uncharacterized protein YjbI with pentapeptide repeats